MILIDFHEPHTISENISTDIPIQILCLKYRDYPFSDTIIERKTLSDFFSSIKSKRLASQIEEMCRFYTERYLIIEGFFDFTYVTNIDYLYSVLSKLMLNYDLNILFSSSEPFTANIIRMLYKKNRKQYHSKKIQFDKPYYAGKLFGISERKLRTLLSKFGNIKNIMNADKKELGSVKSIGKRSIEKVKDVLEGDIL